MSLDRRRFLRSLALASGAAVVPLTPGRATAQEMPATPQQPIDLGRLAGDWQAVRDLFPLSGEMTHMSDMLLASHPAPVARAIARYRAALDADPVRFLEDNNEPLTNEVIAAAAGYLGTEPRAIALTGSTTESVGLVYSGIRLRPGQEVLTTDQDYYVTHESLRLVSQRSGATIRSIPLYDDAPAVTSGMLADTVTRAVGPTTRLVALTWVHSSTGVKLPIAEIAARLRRINASRDENDAVLLAVDGVHGFGVENVSFADLGCDFLMAGCHKWLFGPRGTGIAVASERGWQASLPTIPTFLDGGVFGAWLRGEEPDEVRDGKTMSPGGFKAFEHRWAMTEAFRLHAAVGKDRVMARTHELAASLKEGLARLRHVTLVTPRSSAVSSGIVAFDVEGYSAQGAVDALREKRIIASAAPYAVPHVRLTPSIRNTQREIEAAVAAVAELR